MRTGTNPTCLSAALKWMRGRRIKLKGRGVQGDRRHEYKNNDGRKIIKMRGGSHRIWGKQREWRQNGRTKGKRQEKWMCCLTASRLLLSVCVSNICNKRRALRNKKHCREEENKTSKCEERWARRRGDKGGGEEDGEETKVEGRNGQHDTKTLESRQFNTQTKLQTSQQNDWTKHDGTHRRVRSISHPTLDARPRLTVRAASEVSITSYETNIQPVFSI